MSLFDRLTWAVISYIAKHNPDAAINIMGGADPAELQRKLQALSGKQPPSGPYGVRGPRPPR